MLISDATRRIASGPATVGYKNLIRLLQFSEEQVNPQHAFEIDRRPATIACRIVRPNDVAELRPGQDTIHLIEKLRSARRLGVAIKVGVIRTLVS